MSYIFPKRRLRDKDVLDPTELNEDVAPAAELYSGKLNQHNFETGIEPTLASEAYWKVYHSSQTVDPEWGAYDSGTQMNDDQVDYLTDHFLIPNDGSWAAVENITQTVTTTSSNLWIIGQAQYFWFGFEVSGTLGGTYTPSAGNHTHSADGSRPARVQFALRVNGNIVEGTTTGKSDVYETVPRPWKATDNSRLLSSKKAGPGSDYTTDTTALGPEVLPVRLMTVYPVPPGTHTIEVVCRRLARTDSVSPYSEKDNIYVLNRQLAVVDLPTYAAAATTFSFVDAPAFEAEDVVSAESLGTDRIDAVREKLNSVEAGAAARGAFNHYHLPSMVGAATQQKFHPTSGSGDPVSGITSGYPGYGPSAANFTTSPGADGWYPIADDGTTTYLQSDAITITEDSALLILGNVQVFTPSNDTISDWDSGSKQFTRKAFGNYGCFCIGYKKTADASPTLDAVTEAYVNSYNNDWGDGRINPGGVGFVGDTYTGPAAGKGGENVNIPLMHVMKFGKSETFSFSDALDYIGIFGSIRQDGNTATAGTMKVGRANLIVLHLKKGS
jgi:hypothetical protein